jgi:LAGLIDADG endonuclease
MIGKNPSGADNQQERPGIEQWIVGFVDGEGCFSCPVYRSPKLRLGWQVQPKFAVAQSESSVHVLEMIREFFGCGQVYRNRRRDNHREDLMIYSVFNGNDLRQKVVPFFEEHPLRTAKREAFEKFRLILDLMDKRLHLTIGGLRQIAEIVETMNHRKPSRFLESSEAIRQPTLIRLES